MHCVTPLMKRVCFLMFYILWKMPKKSEREFIAQLEICPCTLRLIIKPDNSHRMHLINCVVFYVGYNSRNITVNKNRHTFEISLFLFLFLATDCDFSQIKIHCLPENICCI